jgi:hypothetical protein
MAAHLTAHAAGWQETVGAWLDDERLPENVRAFKRGERIVSVQVAP